MTTPLPDPLVPAEVDLTDFGFMPLQVNTLLKSTLWIKARKDPRVAHAAVSLWCEAWHQVPAGSLPDDDEVLCALAQCPDDEWPRVRDLALKHFVRCSDGRLYHRVVAVKAIEAWASKVAQRNRTKAATEARKATPRQRDVERDDKPPRKRRVQRDVARNDNVKIDRDGERDDTRNVHQGTGTGTGTISSSTAAENSPNAVATGNPDGGGGRSKEISDGLGQLGVSISASDPTLRRWADEGITDEQLIDAVEEAKGYRNGSRQPIGAAYLDRIVRNAARAGPDAQFPAWRSDDQQCDQLGRALGLWPNAGEEYPAYRQRIAAKLRLLRQDAA